MTFARKLALACIAGALAVGALFILLMRGREASREPAPDEVAALVAPADPSAELLPVEEPSVPAEARKQIGPGAATARVAVAAFEDGGWLLVGRLVRPHGSPPPRVSSDSPATADSLPVQGVRLLLRGHPRKTRPGEVPPPRKLVTGRDGTFAFENVPGRVAMRLEVEGEGWADRAFSFTLEEPDYGARMDLGDIPLEPGSTLVVELAGPDGNLVPGGRVLVGRRSGGKTDELERMGFNDSRREATEAGEGRYVLERAAPGPHRIEALAPRFAPEREEVVLPREEPVRLALEEGGRIAGMIRTDGELPIENASVEVNGSGMLEPRPIVEAEKDGSYIVDFLGTGNYALTAMADGHASAIRSGVPPGSEGIDFTLEKEAVLSGHVVAEGASSPVEGARISLDGAKVPVTAVSDKAGAFTLRKIAPGSYRLLVDHPEYAPHRDEEPFDAAAGDELPRRTVRLGSGIVLRGKVTDAEAGEPVVGATVRLTPAGQGGGSGRKRAAADDQGAFEARALAQGAYEVMASARGYLPSARTTVNVGPEGAEAVEIVLEKASSISGIVLGPGGQPLRGAQVRPNLGQTNNFSWGDNRIFDPLQRAVAETDEEGRFTIEGLHAFPLYVLRATHPDHASAMSPAIAVGPRTSVEGVEITLGRAGELRGRVADEKGNPLRGASVSVFLSQGGPSLMYDTEGNPNADTGADGKFEIRRLAGGSYTVRATSKDREAAVRQDVEVVPGKPGEELEITLGPGVSLSGKVSDESGAPIAGARLQHWGMGNIQATSGPDGLFEMKGLTAGPMDIHVSKSGYGQAQLQTTAPGKDVEIRMDRAAKVSGTVRTKSGEPVAGADVSSIGRGPNMRYGGNSARTSPTGTYEIEVPKGTWVIRASAARRPAGTSSELELAPGDLRENIDIELPDGCTIDGYVFVAGSGEPVEGATISSSVQTSDPWGRSPGGVATRSDGYFVLEGVPEGDVTVTASHADYAPGVASGVQAKVGAKVSVRIELRAGGTVRGRAVRGGNAVTSGWVTARPRSAGAAQRNTQTGPDGSFELKGLAAGDYLIVVQDKNGGGPQLRRAVTVLEGQTVDIDLEGGAGVRLSGRIISQDGVLGEGRVEAIRLDQGVETGSRSDISPAGEYSLELPGPGTYSLMVSFGRGGGGGTKLDVVVPAGSPEVHQDIELPSGRVGGTVVDASTGQAIPNVEVGAFVAGGGRGGSILSLYKSLQVMGRSDDAGRFVLSSLPEGSYDIRAFANGYVQVRRASIQVRASGAAREARVEMQKALSFSARAEDSGGRPISGALALLRDAEGELVLSGNPARSSGDGTLDVQGVVPGTYRMTVSHQAHAPARAVITVLEDGSVSPQPVFRLEKGGKIRLRVASGREPVDGATAEVVDDAGEDLMNDAGFFFLQEGSVASGPDGIIEVGPFPPGVYKVSVTKEGKRSRAEKVAVREGETAEEAFTLE